VAIQLPETHYARAGDVHVAYQVVGAGPVDLAIVPGVVSHVELEWELGAYAAFLDRLSPFCRLIRFDKRGMGMSDRIEGVPTLDERMDDLRAVLDALGLGRVNLLGVSEGAAMALLFAATYPERVESVATFGAFARPTPAAGFPWGHPREFFQTVVATVEQEWGQGLLLPFVLPDAADDEEQRRRFARFERLAASPGAAARSLELNLDIDVRDVLPLIRVPVLVMQTHGDPMVPVDHGRWIAGQIPNGRFLAFPGSEHWPWGAAGRVAAEALGEFVAGTPDMIGAERVLSTVLFTDMVDSTKRAASVADRTWRGVLDCHDRVSRTTIERHRGRVVKSTGDGVLATFDGPARAVRAGITLTHELGDADIPIRAGLHTGEIELRGDDVGGIAVHIAARIAAVAKTEEVLVSRTVKDLVAGSGLAFDDQGEHHFKGVPDPWRLYVAHPDETGRDRPQRRQTI
jgi:pimeloyl-ACP methyl ester carboxylesterase/class 3 adenylate cyclase